MDNQKQTFLVDTCQVNNWFGQNFNYEGKVKLYFDSQIDCSGYFPLVLFYDNNDEPNKNNISGFNNMNHW